ncbi:MAG TPA: c-type cytochrome domain-containing protein, partial [Planctomycetaceae bacterium]|nr:c-type cytochrome domain-containing protein [Planctomycetaceae bacterium]
MRLFCSLLVLTSCVGSNVLSAGEIEFNRDIRPILSDKCFACHGPDHNKRQAELRLDKRDDAVRDRDGHFAIAPGKTDMSELIARITSEDEFTVMPPPETGKPLTEKEIETLTKWIAEGAEYQE